MPQVVTYGIRNVFALFTLQNNLIHADIMFAL